MVIAASDILLRWSVTTGAAGNSTASSQAASLGKYVANNSPTDNSLNNWFGDFSAADNSGLVAKYRGLFVLNNHATDAWNSVAVYLTLPTGLAMAVSWDTTGVTAKGSSSAQAKTIANETTAPATQTFTSPTTSGTAVSLGASIPAGSVALLWVRLTGAGGAAVTPDTEVLNFTGTT